MAHTSPMRRLHQEAEAATLPYGPPIGETPIEVVQGFGDLELEYAAIRKSCVIIDQPQRATLELRGRDRLDFLNRMLTQELKGMAPFRVRRSFWLSRKGRIDADLRVIDLPGRTFLDLDIHAARRTLEGLKAFIVTEDCEIRDRTDHWCSLSLHGPTATELIRFLAAPASGADASGPVFSDLSPGFASVVHLHGREVVIDRDDTTGEPGLELRVRADHALEVYRFLLEAGMDPATESQTGLRLPPPAAASSTGDSQHREPLPRRVKLRPCGWQAYNIARIEAGTAIFNIDFGPESLPHETGVLESRVSFTKGCYLGQEIVARMQNLGHPKQKLVALRLSAPAGTNARDAETGLPLQPATGGAVFKVAPGADMTSWQPGPGDQVGVVTSSTLSPMLSSSAVCFAQVKHDHTPAGTSLVVQAEGIYLQGTVQAGLRFWARK